MHEFHEVGRQLYCEQVPVRRIAEGVGTPCYIYSEATLRRHYRAFDAAFADVPHLIAFALKANANLAILRLFAREGGGADILSGGELHKALAAGVPPSRIVFAGVGKTADEIRAALRAGILMFNVESAQELRLINTVASRMKTQARVALRVNPQVEVGTHPYIATGHKRHKFGINIDVAVEAYRLAARLPHIEIVGIHQHIGSQLTEVRPYVESLTKVLSLVEVLHREGIALQYLDVGGGLGITYNQEKPPSPADLAAAIIPLVKGTGCTLILEPGRALVGNAGILVTRVLYTKEHFVIVDAGMNDLIRPSLYQAYHEIRPVARRARRRQLTVDVVGPVCESGDFLGKDRMLEACRPGELLAIMSAGAYGFTMSSNYNCRPRPAEVLVRGRTFTVIRARETYRDLSRGERIPRFLWPSSSGNQVRASSSSS